MTIVLLLFAVARLVSDEGWCSLALALRCDACTTYRIHPPFSNSGLPAEVLHRRMEPAILGVAPESLRPMGIRVHDRDPECRSASQLGGLAVGPITDGARLCAQGSCLCTASHRGQIQLARSQRQRRNAHLLQACPLPVSRMKRRNLQCCCTSANPSERCWRELPSRDWWQTFAKARRTV